MTGSRRAHALALLALAIAFTTALAGCTSLHWNGVDGRRHHVGLFAIRTIALDAGKRMDLFALGSDGRLAGADAGATLGFHHTRSWIAEERPVVDDARVAAEFTAALTDRLRDVAPDPTWHWFYWVEDESVLTVQTEEHSFGIRWSRSPDLSGLCVGLWSSNRNVGAAIEKSAAVVLVRCDEEPAAGRCLLWRFPSTVAAPGGRSP